MPKQCKIYELYIVEGYSVFGHESLTSENFHDKNKLRSDIRVCHWKIIDKYLEVVS